jgi:hypothetical protein
MVSNDVDPSDGRNETEAQRMDRNWNEMLQEMRVTQTGTQILSGFLLTIAFQPTFAQLDSFQKTLYLCLVCAAAITTALALAPVHLHRSLFRKHSKTIIVALGHLLLRAALIGLATVMIGTVLLVFDVATKNRTAAVLAALGILLVITLLALLPVASRTRWMQNALEREQQRLARPGRPD